MNTFKCSYHGLDASGAFNTPVHSSISHLSNNLIIDYNFILDSCSSDINNEIKTNQEMHKKIHQFV